MFIGSSEHRPTLLLPVCLVAALLTDCSNGDSDPSTREPSAWERAGPGTRIVLAQPPPEPTRIKPTGNPGHDLLRLISDHHASVILMTHAIVESAETTAVVGEARKLEEEHDHELERVARLLRKRFRDSYAGQASLESRFVAGSVRSRPSEDHSRIFAVNAVEAESALIGAIDGLLPKLTDSSTRELVGSISRSHRAELARLRRVFAIYIPEAPQG